MRIRRLLPLFVLIFCYHMALPQASPTIQLPNTHITFQFPDSNWYSSGETDTAQGIYFYKRNPITDPQGRKIIPAIMFFVTDAKSYHGDAIVFSAEKRKPFLEKGLKIDQTLAPPQKDYPLSCKNALFMKCSYTQNGIGHLMYMIHMIDKYDEGIQIYLDMTTDIAKAHEADFMSVVRSIKEQ